MTTTNPRRSEPENDILTLEEVAAYLRLTPQTIYKWAQERRIPAVKLGKEWRFRKSILDRWLDQQMLSEASGFSHLRESEGDEPATPLIEHAIGDPAREGDPLLTRHEIALGRVDPDGDDASMLHVGNQRAEVCPRIRRVMQNPD